MNFCPQNIRITLRFAASALCALLGATILSFSVNTAVAATPTPTPIPNAIIPLGGKGLTVNVSKYFPKPFLSTNSAPINSVYVNSSLGVFYIQLFPSNAPATVANFLRYVNNGLFNNMIVDRLTNNFFETGGYLASSGFPAITNFAPVTNEASLSNVSGTLSMLLDETNPDSATSQWFINTTNNSALYDKGNTNGNLPFTVFGQVVGTNGTNFMNAVAGLPTADLNSLYGLGPQFEEVPLNGWGGSNNPVYFSNLVTIYQMVAIPSVICSDTNSFSVALQGTNVLVTPIAPNTAPVTITVYTVDPNGSIVFRSFQVSTSKLRQSIYFPVNETAYGTEAYIFNNLDGSTNNPYSYYPSSSAGLGVGARITSGPAYVSTNGQLFFKSPGVVTLTAAQAGNLFYPPASATGYIIVDRATQTLSSFPTITNQTTASLPYKLTLTNLPTSSAGLSVSVTVAGPAKIAGKNLSISGAGTITLTAKQPGNANYYSATPISTNFTVTIKP